MSYGYVGDYFIMASYPKELPNKNKYEILKMKNDKVGAKMLCTIFIACNNVKQNYAMT